MMNDRYPKIYDEGVISTALEITGQEPREVKIERYFPDVLARAREFMALAAAINPELMAVSSALWRLMLNTFVYRLDAQGAKRWETMLGIYPPVGASLDARRYEILLKINNVLPYTYRSFQNMLDSTFGAGVVEMDLDAENYCLHLLLSTDFYEFYDRLKTFTRATVPANLGMLMRFSWLFKENAFEDNIDDKNFRLGLNVSFEENLDLGVIRYRKPVVVGHQYNGAKRYDGEIAYNSYYTAENHYRVPVLVGHLYDGAKHFDGEIAYNSRYTVEINNSSPANSLYFYEEGDAALLFLYYRYSVRENYARLLYDGRAAFDGTQKFDGNGLHGVTYDGGVKAGIGISLADNSTFSDDMGELSIITRHRFVGEFAFDGELSFSGETSESIPAY